MKLSEREVRGAMDRRLSFLDADGRRRARIRRRIAKEEEPAVKRKLTAGMALAIGLALVLAGVALAAGLNVFEYFKDEDTRYAEIAPQAEIATQAPVTVENDVTGTTLASITNAYYDGSSLLVAYTIQNGTRMEAFTPTDAQLAQMTRMERAMPVMIEGNAEASLVMQYNKALQSGKPFGYSTYAVYPSDHTRTDDGIDLAPATETQDVDAEGTLYAIREYETLLPDREYLKLEIQLWQSVTYLYFDGTDAYVMGDERKDAGAMAATVWRADVPVLHMTGSGIWRNAAVTAEADISAVHAELTLKSNADVFPLPEEDNWYDVVMRDADGNTLRTEGCGAEDAHTLRASFQGTGSVPGTVSVWILLRSEGAYDEEAAMAAVTPIVLTATEE